MINLSKILQFWIPLLLFFILPCGLWSKPLSLDSDSLFNPVPVFELFTGPPGTTFDRILESDQFKPYPKKFIDIGSTDRPLWFRFTVKNDYVGQYWILSLSNLRMDLGELYIPTESGDYRKKVTGDKIPVMDWSDPDLYFSFRFYLNQNEEKTLYLCLRHNFKNSTEVNIRGPSAYTEFRTRINYVLIFLLIATLFFIVYMAYLYRLDRKEEYLYIIPAGVLFFLFNFTQLGPTYWFWPGWPLFQDRIFKGIGIATIISISLLVRKLLHLKKSQPVVDRIILGLTILEAVFLILNFVYASVVFNRILILTFLTLYILFVFVTIRSRKSEYQTGNLMLLWFILAITVVYRMGVLLNILPYNGWYKWTMLFQLPLFLFFLSRLLIKNVVHLSRKGRDLEVRFHALQNQLSKSSHDRNALRMGSLDVERILGKIDSMVKTDPSFFDPEFNLKEMAEILEIRPDQLSHILNKELQLSFSSFLNTIRVHRSCELMRLYPDKNITHIFLDSGFSNKSTFNQAFQKLMGMSPRQFRNGLHTDPGEAESVGPELPGKK